MPRSTKDSQTREDEEDVEAPRVDEIDADATVERSPSKLDADADEEISDEDLIEEIDLEDLAAMEGPDA